MKPGAEKDIRAEAIIYRKEKIRPLSNYQKQINKCAQDIAARDPSLLVNRGKLLEAAKSAVYESGYSFKKGYSRSKRFLDDTMEAVKRPKINKDMREKRIQNIEEELTDLRQRISFKEKRVNAAENIKNYKVCDEITGEISEIKAKCRELEAELKLLLMKEKRAQKHYLRQYKYSTSSTSGDQSEDNVGSPGSVSGELTSFETSEDQTSSGDIRTYMKESYEFTAEEIKRFERRLEEQYDLPDDRYDKWLERFHPNAPRLTTAKAVSKGKTDGSSLHISVQGLQGSSSSVVEISEDTNSDKVHPF